MGGSSLQRHRSQLTEDGVYNLNTADWSVDLTGAPTPVLRFMHDSDGNESHTQNGVLVRDNGGATFRRILSAQRQRRRDQRHQGSKKTCGDITTAVEPPFLHRLSPGRRWLHAQPVEELHHRRRGVEEVLR
ncbi:MAG: hypothetical protein H6838_10505 [Planctomycetes bacterium]|nr:hypothetical protein [Planctomycetota bacterium]